MEDSEVVMPWADGFIIWCLLCHYGLGLCFSAPFLLISIIRWRSFWATPTSGSFTCLLFLWSALLSHLLEDFGYLNCVGIGGF